MDVAVSERRTKKRKPAKTADELRSHIASDISGLITKHLIRRSFIDMLKQTKWFEYNDKFYPRPNEGDVHLSERYYLRMKKDHIPIIGHEYMIGIATEVSPNKILCFPATIRQVGGKQHKCLLVKITTSQEIIEFFHPSLQDIVTEEYILLYYYKLNTKIALNDSMEPPDPKMNFRGGPAYLKGLERWERR